MTKECRKTWIVSCKLVVLLQTFWSLDTNTKHCRLSVSIQFHKPTLTFDFQFKIVPVQVKSNLFCLMQGPSLILIQMHLTQMCKQWQYWQRPAEWITSDTISMRRITPNTVILMYPSIKNTSSLFHNLGLQCLNIS